MHWIYILECEDNYYYVGETTKLYRRFNQHFNGEGGINTSIFSPVNIVAIYKSCQLNKFFDYNYRIVNNIYDIYFNKNKEILKNFNSNEYNNLNDEYDKLFIENNITECLMLNNKNNYKKIRGGKYTRFDIEYCLPKNEHVQNLPVCYCGLPCDIKKNEKYNYLYFRCAKKNIWPNLREKFDIQDECCNFFMKYKKDINYNIFFRKKKETIKNLTTKSFWLETLIGDVYMYCIGGCGKEFDMDNTVRYSGRAINLCFDCFVNKHNELSKRYNICLIDDD
jgi:hypothetical protein